MLTIGSRRPARHRLCDMNSNENDESYEVVVKHDLIGVLHNASFQTLNQAYAYLRAFGQNCPLIATSTSSSAALSMTSTTPGSAFLHLALTISLKRTATNAPKISDSEPAAVGRRSINSHSSAILTALETYLHRLSSACRLSIA